VPSWCARIKPLASGSQEPGAHLRPGTLRIIQVELQAHFTQPLLRAEVRQDVLDGCDLLGAPVHLSDRVPDHRKVIPPATSASGNQLLAAALSMFTGCFAATAIADLRR
jgi:hypothetical protein